LRWIKFGWIFKFNFLFREGDNEDGDKNDENKMIVDTNYGFFYFQYRNNFFKKNIYPTWLATSSDF